jgi:glucan phosphoethanolaminetransferase (alkaline phosphatase superfamily)
MGKKKTANEPSDVGHEEEEEEEENGCMCGWVVGWGWLGFFFCALIACLPACLSLRFFPMPFITLICFFFICLYPYTPSIRVYEMFPEYPMLAWLLHTH